MESTRVTMNFYMKAGLMLTFRLGHHETCILDSAHESMTYTNTRVAAYLSVLEVIL